MRSSKQSLMLTAGFVLVVVLVGLLTAVTGNAAAQSAGFVDVDASDLNGSGTVDDPYVITNASELQAMEDDLDAYYVPGNDIDASSTAQWNGGSGFDSVGEFTGSLNGNGHSIIGLTIDRSNLNGVGLFSGTDSSTVTNLSVINATVTGNRDVGLVVGENTGGTIRNITATGSVTGITDVGGLVGRNHEAGAIIQSDASADVSGSSQDVGGLVGTNDGESTVNGSHATGDVTGDNTDVGGLVGRNIGQIADSYATGNVNANDNGSQSRSGNRAGGLTGYNQGTIVKSYATGTVTGATRVGGLVGVNFDYNGTETVVRSSYATGDVTGTGGSVGGFVGSNSEGAAVGNLVPSLEIRVTNSYATGDVIGEGDRVGGFIGYNNGTIGQSFATGEVVGSGDNTGGFAGENDEQIDSSYWDTQSTSQSESAGSATGLPTAEMQDDAARDNMVGLDFETIWQTQSNGYPVLQAGSNSESDGADPIAEYRNDEDEVEITGLRSGIDDFTNGDIDIETLRTVIDEFTA